MKLFYFNFATLIFFFTLHHAVLSKTFSPDLLTAITAQTTVPATTAVTGPLEAIIQPDSDSHFQSALNQLRNFYSTQPLTSQNGYDDEEEASKHFRPGEDFSADYTIFDFRFGKLRSVKRGKEGKGGGGGGEGDDQQQNSTGTYYVEDFYLLEDYCVERGCLSGCTSQVDACQVTLFVSNDQQEHPDQDQATDHFEAAVNKVDFSVSLLNVACNISTHVRIGSWEDHKAGEALMRRGHQIWWRGKKRELEEEEEREGKKKQKEELSSVCGPPPKHKNSSSSSSLLSAQSGKPQQKEQPPFKLSYAYDFDPEAATGPRFPISVDDPDLLRAVQRIKDRYDRSLDRGSAWVNSSTLLNSKKKKLPWSSLEFRLESPAFFYAEKGAVSGGQSGALYNVAFHLREAMCQGCRPEQDCFYYLNTCRATLWDMADEGVTSNHTKLLNIACSKDQRRRPWKEEEDKKGNESIKLNALKENCKEEVVETPTTPSGE